MNALLLLLIVLGVVSVYINFACLVYNLIILTLYIPIIKGILKEAFPSL